MRPSHRYPRRQRRGYAMVLVVVFLLILLSTLGLAYRQMATTLQLEMARTQQIDFEQGSLKLGSIGLGMLEGPLSTPFTMAQSYSTSAGTRWYTLQLTRLSVDPGTGRETWSVTVTPQ